jgi:hypothetical protein
MNNNKVTVSSIIKEVEKLADVYDNATIKYIKESSAISNSRLTNSNQRRLEVIDAKFKLVAKDLKIKNKLINSTLRARVNKLTDKMSDEIEKAHSEDINQIEAKYEPLLDTLYIEAYEDECKSYNKAINTINTLREKVLKLK